MPLIQPRPIDSVEFIFLTTSKVGRSVIVYFAKDLTQSLPKIADSV